MPSPYTWMPPEGCDCGSCRKAREQFGKPCNCCQGQGIVLSALGHPRPCSRCNTDGFSAWRKANRQADEVADA